MEELTANLANSFQVTTEPLSVAKAHPRFAQYKQKSRLDQDERRQRMLDVQKQKRFDYVRHVRRLADDDWGDYSGSDDDDYNRKHKNVKYHHVSAKQRAQQKYHRGNQREEPMETSRAYFRRPGTSYKNQLMLSEWLVEVPSNFEQDWLMVICPIGKRSLVVASRGITTVYSRSGILVNQFKSHLPGGGSSGRRDDYTILDCIFSEITRTYYVLDIMSWAAYPVMDSETDFRFFWMTSKLQENPLCTAISSHNPYCFKSLSLYDCSKASITQAMTTPQPFEVDGVLFYHKGTHYTFGSTPLVVWLRPYMVPEILNVPVLDCYMEKMPQNYTNYEEHMELVKKNRELRKLKHNSPKTKQTPSAHTQGEAIQEVTSPEIAAQDLSTKRSHRKSSGGKHSDTSRESAMESVVSDDIRLITHGSHEITVMKGQGDGNVLQVFQFTGDQPQDLSVKK